MTPVERRVWGQRRGDGTGRVLLATSGSSALLLGARGLWHLGFPAPSEL